MQDGKGRPIDGFSLSDSIEIYGDSIERPVAWKLGTDVGPLAGKAVRLLFELKDADLFSFRFR